jgi:hypothetical protein
MGWVRMWIFDKMPHHTAMRSYPITQPSLKAMNFDLSKSLLLKERPVRSGVKQ